MKKPKNSSDLFERALAFEQRGRIDDAAGLYRKIISRSPEHDPALFRLSVILLQSGLVEESSRYLERAVGVRRDQPEYLTTLGEVYLRQGKLELATAVLTYALQVDPDSPVAHQHLALVQMQNGAPREAIEHLERVVELRPTDALGHVSLSWALLLTQRPVEALEFAQRAADIDPNFAAAHRCIGDAFDQLGDKSHSIPSYRRAVELNPEDHVAHSNLIVSMLTDPSYDSRALLAEARAWSKLHAEPLRAQQRPHENAKEAERRLRIGYVSPDFRVHAVQQFLIRLLEQHDSSAFEVFLYSSVERPDAQTAWYRSFAGERFRDIQRLGDVDAAELIRRDGIDILVDLAVHGAGNRLRVFACKPAPLQFTWLGYAGSSGLDSIDYRITDPHIDPAGSDLSVYTETSLHLPETFWAYDALESNLPVAPLPALANGFVTLGCLNSPRKLTPQATALWARVLGAIPESRLLIYVEEYGREALRRTFSAAGIDAARIEFVGRVPRRAYLERHDRIDVALDTFPFAGGTTSLDAIWMGVPFVTLSGRTALQRAGVSIAMNLALPELIAHTEDEYVERAVALTHDLERLSSLRRELRSRLQTSPLADSTRFARNLEAAYRNAWRRYCAPA